MERKDIIINGVSINELKSQRAAIREGASKLISESIDLAKSLTQKLIDAENKEELEKLAAEAYEALETADVVSGVSGVTFYLEYYDEYGDNSGIMSRKLECSENDLVTENWEGNVSKLYDLFDNMESQSRDWNSSNCY